MTKSDLRPERRHLVDGLSADDRLRYFDLLRPQEIEMVLRRDAFLDDRKRMIRHLRKPGVSSQRISTAAGYAAGTLGGVLSESAVERQLRYNTRVLTVCMRVAGLKPSPILDEYHKGETGPRSEEVPAEYPLRDEA